MKPSLLESSKKAFERVTRSTRMEEEMISKPWKVGDDDSYSTRRKNVPCYDKLFCKIRISAALTRHL
jgi:hypothetical protein